MSSVNGFHGVEDGFVGAEVSGIGSAALGDLSEELPEDVREKVVHAGAEFARAVSAAPEAASCLLISGQLGYYADADLLFENRVKASLLKVWGYPDQVQPRPASINVLVDSRGGWLDSAFRIVLYLSAYTDQINVYVPRRAKSASTLIALGATTIFLSPFGELGPLDTQIDDPRFAKKSVSALDFYQSVDYVRSFGLSTLEGVLGSLTAMLGNRMSQAEIVEAASSFALGSVAPMMASVEALDFGAWGRSLKIGERYAQALLRRKGQTSDRAKEISTQLVYNYTHHPRPIDYVEAHKILHLPAQRMPGQACEPADRIVNLCDDRAFVGFLSPAEAAKEAQANAAAEAIRQAADGESKQRADLGTRSTGASRGDGAVPNAGADTVVATASVPSPKPPRPRPLREDEGDDDAAQPPSEMSTVTRE